MKYLIIAFLFFTLTLSAQTSVSGNVYDADTNEPLNGANIFVKNKPQIGMPSGEDGFFKLNGLENNDELVFSFVGYESKTLPLKNENSSNPLSV
ncbi:MAG: carboxypeptidase-like regulatory domain-containing protein, partial [Ignavibacteriaceae bacterium]|nr:carboxypeptidase-like regulatory domain-containing protein [Ignavibacteriaceae bacterium]